MIEYNKAKNKSLSNILDKVMYSQTIRFNLDSSRKLSNSRHHSARLNVPAPPQPIATQSPAEQQDRESVKSHDKIYAVEPFQPLGVI